MPDVPAGAVVPVGVDSMFRLNRNLTALPCVTGVSHGLFGDYDASIQAMADAVDEAEQRCTSSSSSPHGTTPQNASLRG